MVVPTATYGEVHPGSLRVPVCLHNLSAYAIDVPTKTVVGQVVPANQIHLVVHLTDCGRDQSPSTKGMGFGGLYLQGLKEWPE